MTEIERRTEQVEVFVVGGRRFLDEQSARQHLDELQRISSKRYRFYVIEYGVEEIDCRCWVSREAVAAPSEGALIALLLRLCDGPRTECMGGRSVDSWRIAERVTEPLQSTADVQAYFHGRFREVVVLDADGFVAERLATKEGPR